MKNRSVAYLTTPIKPIMRFLSYTAELQCAYGPKGQLTVGWNFDVVFEVVHMEMKVGLQQKVDSSGTRDSVPVW